MDEIQDVLSRPELLLKFPLLTSAASEMLLRTARQKSVLLADLPHAFTLPRDPDDEIYLDLAIAGDAQFLVTWNEKHLSYLMKRDTPEGEAFCRCFPNLSIVDPPSFLNALRATEV